MFWNCIRLPEDWWDLSPEGGLRNLLPDHENPSPYKANQRSLLFDLPGGSCTKLIRTDPAHTYHIGYGKDENASIIVELMAVGHFGGGSIWKKMDAAFQRFSAYCAKYKKHTSITEFSKSSSKSSRGSLSTTGLDLTFGSPSQTGCPPQP